MCSPLENRKIIKKQVSDHFHRVVEKRVYFPLCLRLELLQKIGVSYQNMSFPANKPGSRGFSKVIISFQQKYYPLLLLGRHLKVIVVLLWIKLY